ncbi:MAG TPA: hypothetical protein VFO91_09090 [Anaerolineales bacterium]|nr:hypothetical protein [Anaerolineales bacterium]
MFQIPPWGLILLGVLFMLTGTVLPFLMVIRLLPSTFFLNFFSYGISVVGLFIGVIGVSLYVRGSGK